MFTLFDGWNLKEPCPYCGCKKKWISNLMHDQEGSILMAGHFECLNCKEKNEKHMLKLELRTHDHFL